MICILVGLDKNLYSFLNEGVVSANSLKKKKSRLILVVRDEFETVTLNFSLQHPLYSVKPLVYC